VHFCYCWPEQHRYLKISQEMQVFYVIKLPCSGEQQKKHSVHIIHSLYEFIVFLYKMMKIGNCEFVHLLILFEIEGK